MIRLSAVLLANAALAILAFALLAVPSVATANSVQCGDVITEDLKLQADLTDCPDDGLVVGADRITINLNGHEVSDSCVNSGEVRECDGKVGIDNSGGYDRVRIRNGTVDGFGQSILLEGASRNTLAALQVVDNSFQQGSRLTLMDSDRNLIRDSVFHYGELAARFTDAHHNKIARTRIWGGTGIRDGAGLELLGGSDANTFVASDLDGSSFGIRIMNSARNRFMNGLIAGGFGTRDADRTVIAGNLLEGAGQGFGALYVRGNRSTIRDNVGSTIGVEGDRNLVVANQTEGAFFDTPIEVAGGDRNVVRRNSATGARADVGPVIWVGAAASRTTLARNTASAARSGNESMGGPFAIGDGIRVDARGTLIRGNTATDNDALGINAVDGVIDGGDNHASGNGDPRQCVGVVCTP